MTALMNGLPISTSFTLVPKKPCAYEPKFFHHDCRAQYSDYSAAVAEANQILFYEILVDRYACYVTQHTSPPHNHTRHNQQQQQQRQLPYSFTMTEDHHAKGVVKFALDQHSPSPRRADRRRSPAVSVLSNDFGFGEDEHGSSHHDDDFLHRVLADAGRWAFGVVYAEVWVATMSSGTRLIRPGSGWWVDPSFRLDCPSIDRLFDDSAEDGFPLEPVAPGVGLPGALWSELNAKPRRKSSIFMSNANNSGLGLGNANANRRRRSSVELQPEQSMASLFSAGEPDSRICWRNVHSLANDPHRPWDARLKHTSDIGLGWAAGVSFEQRGGTKGLVLFYARGTADYAKLSHRDNEAYLRQATRVIGAAYGLRQPRRVVVAARRTELDAVLRRVRHKILALIALGVKLETLADNDVMSKKKKKDKTNGGLFSLPSSSSGSGHNPCTDIAGRVGTVARKARGAGVPPPPAFAWDQTAWTFTGTFTTMMVLTLLSDVMAEEWGESIVLGPFGALVTLQYALTAAPACQPPNIVLGQALSLIIAQSIGQIDEDVISPWLKTTLATSLAITLMVKTGLTHPPAGAAAVLFSSGKFSWTMVGIMILANLVAISTSTLINNLSEKRQYPTFWGLDPLLDGFRELWSRPQVAEEEVDRKPSSMEETTSTSVAS